MTCKVITCASVTILAYHATYIATLPAMSPNTNHIYIYIYSSPVTGASFRAWKGRQK